MAKGTQVADVGVPDRPGLQAFTVDWQGPDGQDGSGIFPDVRRRTVHVWKAFLKVIKKMVSQAILPQVLLRRLIILLELSCLSLDHLINT